MSSKQQDAATSNISPVLFMAVDGQPMSFFLRPGPVKQKLQPLIVAGGGALCNVQKPGAILLMDPSERGSISETTVHWYISTQYISDCVEKNEQLNLEDYRLNPAEGQRHSARLSKSRGNYAGLLGGRVPYTAEDDAAILRYVSKHKAKIGGNRLWQDMEKQHVTGHSWQSMKYRYRVGLSKKQLEEVNVRKKEEETETAEGEAKDENGGAEVQEEEACKAEDAASPQTQMTASDIKKADDASTSADNAQPELAEAQASICPSEETLHVDTQTDKQPDESTKGAHDETETSKSFQPEGPCLDPPTDSQPLPAESTETDEPQTMASPQKGSVPEDSPAAQTTSLSDASSHKKSKEKKKSSPMPERTEPRLTRRRLQLEESPGSDGTKNRSASSLEQPSSSPQPRKKTSSVIMSALQTVAADDQPPSKKARRKSLEAVAEDQQEESTQAAVSEAGRADTGSVSAPQKGKKRKRKLGILEMATREFESESDEDEALDPIDSEPPLPSPDTVDDDESGPEPEPGLQEKVQETQASGSRSPSPAVCSDPPIPEAISATSKAHLFIFDSESQEEESQSVLADRTAAPVKPQPAVDKDSAFSLTQIQLEEDKQRIRELMEEANQDIISVTKALLKTNGDFAAAQDLLLNPFSGSGPIWRCCDDDLLTSGDPAGRQQLQVKYGEELLAKRVMFLELEG